MSGPPAKGPPAPPTADDIPDIQHELRILEVEWAEDDPERRFAMAYVQLGVPAAAYRFAFPDENHEDDKKAFVLGHALLNSPNVQVYISEIYDRVGSRLKISPDALMARLWQTANSPGLPAKEVAKLIEAIDKIRRGGGDGGGEGDRVPQVHVHIGSSVPAPAIDASVRVKPSAGGDASIPRVLISVDEELDAPLPEILP